MKKLMIIAIAALTMIGGAGVKASAKVSTPEQAATKLYAAEKKAYKEKKSVTVKVRLKGKRSNAHKVLEKVQAAVVAKRWAGHTNNGVSVVFLDKLECFIDHSCSEEDYIKKSYSFNKKSFTLTTKFLGSRHIYREEYQQISYLKRILTTIQKSITPDMDEFDRAWVVAKYVATNWHYDLDSDMSWGAVYKGTSHSVCGPVSVKMNKLVRCFGVDCYSVGSKKEEHDWNAIKVDGKYYYFDAQCVSSVHDDYVEYHGMSQEDLNNCVYGKKELVWKYANTMSEGHFAIVDKKSFLNDVPVSHGLVSEDLGDWDYGH